MTALTTKLCNNSSINTRFACLPRPKLLSNVNIIQFLDLSHRQQCNEMFALFTVAQELFGDDISTHHQIDKLLDVAEKVLRTLDANDRATVERVD
jgi:hypothetical protein